MPVRRSRAGFLAPLAAVVFVTSCAVPRAGDGRGEALAPPRHQRVAPPPHPVAEQFGTASYYGQRHHGRLTASGERFDATALTAAHPSLPFGTVARVTDVSSGRWVTVRITDRGPFYRGRVIDLSYAAAQQLGMVDAGLARVRIEVLGMPRAVAAG